MFNLPHKDFTLAVTNMTKELKETVSKELKEIMSVMSHQIV